MVVDEERRPLGWVEGGRVSGPVQIADLDLGGTLAPVDGSLRAALDAALSAPSGRGVIVDDEGILLGTVRASEVLDAIAAAERPERGTA